MEKERVTGLDGLRGVAILLVVSFHYFIPWPELYPYGHLSTNVVPFKIGYLGVQLFFIISGFVISKSLARSASFFEFARKRADRLVAPMIIMSSVTVLLLTTILADPRMPTSWFNLVPSWTFTVPRLWTWDSPTINYADNSYWTLSVEVRFYIIFGALWFLLGGKRATVAFTTLAIAAPVLWAILPTAGALAIVRTVLFWGLFPEQIAYLALGVLLAALHEQPKRRGILLPALALFGIAEVQQITNRPADAVLLVVAVFLCVSAVVLVAVKYPIAKAFEWRPLTFVGVVSYSLYLIHQSVGVLLIAKIPPGYPLVAQLSLVVLVIAGMIALAWASWRWVEQAHIVRWVHSQLAQPVSNHSPKAGAVPSPIEPA